MKNFSMKSFENSLKGNNTPHLKDYQTRLQEKNFTKETIEKYLYTVKQYGNREINTNSVAEFIRKNLTKCEPATLRSKRNALASYAKFQKKHAKIE